MSDRPPAALEAVDVTRTYHSPGVSPRGKRSRGGTGNGRGGGEGKGQGGESKGQGGGEDTGEGPGEGSTGSDATSAPGVSALRGVTLRIEPGEYVAIVGPSGSGKSTLMHLLGCLDRPTSGLLRVGGRDVSKLSDAELAELRNSTIGFVFQSFHLLARTSALDNVALPLVYRGVPAAERRRRAAAALTTVGLAHRLDHWPSQLSGGEQQRVAIARALVGDPEVVLADEPTGNLDTRTGDEVMELLERLNADHGVAVVLVTHESDVAGRARRQIHVRDGLVEHDTADITDTAGTADTAGTGGRSGTAGADGRAGTAGTAGNEA